ncbi:tetracycline resistance protein, class A [Drosophila busckii]|uniref:tetracycline resistance protein, class A n=1 Tax=Drosophila busckii TaxID=30019 RepID=UPI00083F06D3|nr:tetracycline resistance protein, class A [Drosophila busckii]
MDEDTWNVPHDHERMVDETNRSLSSEKYIYNASEENTVSATNDYRSVEEDANVGSESGRSFLLEPLILILLFAYNFSSTILKAQIIYQSCTAGLGYPNDDCLLLGTKNASSKHMEDAVQQYATRVITAMTIIEFIVPAYCGLFVGALADRYGRKPLLMASFLGYGLQYLISACIAYVAMQSQGMVSPWFYVITIIPLSLLGSRVTYSVAAICYIGDVSTGRMRSYRMIAVELCIYVGLMLGSYSSGYVFKASNAYIVFVISAASIFYALLVMALLLPESLRVRQLNTGFGLGQMWRSCIGRREFKDRTILILIMCILLLATIANDGNNVVFYMFVREKFHWTVREFTNFETVSILVPAVAGSGGVLFLWSLRHYTKSAILCLALISLLSHMSSSLMTAFAFVDWQIYLAVGLGVFKSLVNPMGRTMITNLLPTNERGKVFGMLSVLQTLSPIIGATLYALIYADTLDTAPGLFNLISGTLFGLAIVLLLIVWRLKSSNAAHYDPIFF